MFAGDQTVMVTGDVTVMGAPSDQMGNGDETVFMFGPMGGDDTDTVERVNDEDVDDNLLGAKNAPNFGSSPTDDNLLANKRNETDSDSAIDNLISKMAGTAVQTS